MCTRSRNVNIPKKPSCVASNMCASSRNVIIPPAPPHPHPTLTIWQVENEKQFEQFFDKKCTKPSRNACFENLMIFLSQICDENLKVCMSVKRTLKVYEILQIAMNPARAFVTHICKTLKNGTGFQATCTNMGRFPAQHPRTSPTQNVNSEIMIDECGTLLKRSQGALKSEHAPAFFKTSFCLKKLKAFGGRLVLLDAKLIPAEQTDFLTCS